MKLMCILTSTGLRFVFRPALNVKDIVPIGEGFYCKIDGTPWENGWRESAADQRRSIMRTHDEFEEFELTGPMKSKVEHLFENKSVRTFGQGEPNTPFAGLSKLLDKEK